MNVRVLIGSKKGAFVLESDSERRDWRVRGPLCEHWPLTHVAADLADGTIYATGGNAWSGRLCGSRMTVAQLGPIRARGWLTPRRDAGKCAWVAHAARAAVRRRRAAGLFVSGDGARVFEGGGSAPHPRALDGNRRDRRCLDPSFPIPPTFVASGSASPVRRVLHGGRRRNLESAQFGTRCDFLPEGERYPSSASAA